ncbi:hypothetical protein VNO77_02894 [Canavalia gladiata]|uniref:Uncharacterized protein n=1 Tax=Canavalia gladiata TaxID=3824 RepID=A0AAN9MZ05_CANGL
MHEKEDSLSFLSSGEEMIFSEAKNLRVGFSVAWSLEEEQGKHVNSRQKDEVNKRRRNLTGCGERRGALRGCYNRISSGFANIPRLVGKVQALRADGQLRGPNMEDCYSFGPKWVVTNPSYLCKHSIQYIPPWAGSFTPYSIRQRASHARPLVVGSLCKYLLPSSRDDTADSVWAWSRKLVPVFHCLDFSKG